MRFFFIYKFIRMQDDLTNNHSKQDETVYKLFIFCVRQLYTI